MTQIGMDEVWRDAMVGHARCLVKIYAVVESPSWYNVRPAATREDGRPSRYHRTKGIYLYWGRLRCGVRWAGVSISGLKYDSRKLHMM